jgi:TPR repeat protein
MFSFVRPPPRFPRLFAGAPVYGMSLTHVDRLLAVGCGFKGKLVRMLALGVGRHFEPQRNRRACHQMMQINARRVASKLMAAVRDEAAKEAHELCASGQCAAALVPLQRAIGFGDLPSRALKAWMLMDGREGVAKDEEKAFDLAEEGARFGCYHCQGVMACFYHFGLGCRPNQVRSLELARESAGRGSRYGQYTLGQLHGFGRVELERGIVYAFGRAGLKRDFDQQLVFLRLAAAQGLDAAQCQLGALISDGYHSGGYRIAHDPAEGLRLFQLAAAQGCPEALSMVAECHQFGSGVASDVAEAIRWYRRAQTAGNADAADIILKLGARHPGRQYRE